MAHHITVKQNSYYNLTKRINIFPQRAPPSAALFEILRILFSEKEVGLVSLLPIKPFTVAKAAKIWKMKESEARQILNDFADRGVLTDAENSLHILDYERASEVIKTATHIGIGICYCRHKMEHLGRNCTAPMEICMTFNESASSLTRHGISRHVDAVEGLDLLQKARDMNLVQFGENVREKVIFICNCCRCCCEALIASRRFGFLHPVHTTSYIPVISDGDCNGCGKCVSLCPVEAMVLISSNDPQKPLGKKAKLQEDICLGCGVCLQGCNKNAIKLNSRKERVITPLNSVHRVVVMAIERGKLHNLIFDNHVMMNHRVFAAVLGVILKLPPVKQLLASKQFKSRYLEGLIRRQKSE